MSTRIPKTVEQAIAEINTAIDEINRAQSRIKKASRFLLHEGNTSAKSTAHYHYSSALRQVHQHFTRIRDVMGDAWDRYQEALREVKP